MKIKEISRTWGRHSQSRPGNMGFPLSISANTQPTLHMSIARVYSLNVSVTSGARYHLDDGSDSRLGEWGCTHRVATYSVMNVLLSLATFGGGRADRARPKSQSWRG